MGLEINSFFRKYQELIGLISDPIGLMSQGSRKIVVNTTKKHVPKCIHNMKTFNPTQYDNKTFNPSQYDYKTNLAPLVQELLCDPTKKTSKTRRQSWSKERKRSR